MLLPSNTKNFPCNLKCFNGFIIPFVHFLCFLSHPCSKTGNCRVIQPYACPRSCYKSSSIRISCFSRTSLVLPLSLDTFCCQVCELILCLSTIPWSSIYLEPLSVAFSFTFFLFSLAYVDMHSVILVSVAESMVKFSLIFYTKLEILIYKKSLLFALLSREYFISALCPHDLANSIV